MSSLTRSRRTQAITLLATIVLIYVLFFSTESSTSTSFRTRTETAIARKHSPLRGDLSDEALLAQTNDKLAEVISKKGDGDDYWKTKVISSPEPTDAQGRTVLKGTRTAATVKETADKAEDEIPVAGRKSMPKAATMTDQQRKQDILKDKEKPRYPKAGGDEEEAFNGNKVESASDPGEEMARHELQSILKKSPIIIFSKSYCPYSKRAKNVLLEEYDIVPKPYVVELDLMTEKVPKRKGYEGGDKDVTLGRKVQDLLLSITTRRTVPNILVNSVSLGGSDEIGQLNTQGELASKIKEMGGKRIISVTKKGKSGEGDKGYGR